jgi:hypothetical protein
LKIIFVTYGKNNDAKNEVPSTIINVSKLFLLSKKIYKQRLTKVAAKKTIKLI